MLQRCVALVTVLVLSMIPSVGLASHNPLHAYQEKLAAFINDLTTFGLILLPLVVGLAIVAVAIWRAISKAGGANNLHEHDDRIKQLLGYLIVGESALGLVAIVSYFFK